MCLALSEPKPLLNLEQPLPHLLGLDWGSLPIPRLILLLLGLEHELVEKELGALLYLYL